MNVIKEYVESHKDRFLNELFDLIRIPSVSSKSDGKDDMLKAAEYLKNALLKAGADHAEVKNTKGWPVVYGHKIIDKSLPTVLVYGHYDVQPAEPLNLWASPPFEPEVREGKIYARGADDDKGQLFMHLKAFELMISNNMLPCNVKFMIEGEEEIGSPSLKQCSGYNTDL
jgi:acetylornithine deacetylase/succinyl-diaminopimelate desuccinylase-like protein